MSDKTARIAAMTLGIASALGGPYADQALSKPKALPLVIHRETCPCCGKALVNLYRRNGSWRCSECWEKSPADQADKEGAE